MNIPIKYWLPLLFLLLAWLFWASGQVWAAPAPLSGGQADQAGPGGGDPIPSDQIIVKLKGTVRQEDLSSQDIAREEQRLIQAAGVPLSYVRPMSGQALVFRLSARMPVDQVAAIARRLAALPEVEYAEPDTLLQPMRVPNDPRYGEQWHYFAPSSGDYGINLPAAWNVTTGSASTVAAVVDTGITNHVEFIGRTVPGYDFISDEQVANDGDGRDGDASDPGDWITLADSLGYFAGCPVRDSSWHGTHTAGTIGAASNNNAGVAGINWKAKILPVRVLGKCYGQLSDIIDGMRWAAGLPVPGVPNNTHPAKVINLSLGGMGTCGSTMQDAIDDIHGEGAMVVASAGNFAVDAGGFTPANCEGVITVAATNRTGSRAYYSNYGSTVEISAPGGETIVEQNGVLSTWNTGTQGPVADGYKFYPGTSMSAPHVTGVASLLYSLDPNLTPAQVLQILQDTATNFPAGSTCTTSDCGSGIVNAGRAVLRVAETETHPLFMPIVRSEP